MKLIVAVNNKGYIGKAGKLMWKCRADLQHFKKLTYGCQLILGRKTFDICLGGKPLPNRFHNVITDNKELSTDFRYDNVNYGKLPEMVKTAMIGLYISGAEGVSKIWVAGGADIYRQLVYMCDEIHLSIINDDQEGDARFDVPSDYRGEVIIYNFEPDGETVESTEGPKGHVATEQARKPLSTDGI